MEAGGGEVSASYNHDISLFKARGLASETEHVLSGLAARVIAGEYDFKDRREAVNRVRDQVDGQRSAESPWRRIARGRLDTCNEPVVDPFVPDEFGDAAIVAFREQHFRAGRATLIVAGGFDEAVARAHVKAAFGGQQAPWGGGAKAPARHSRPAPAVKPSLVRMNTGNHRQIGALLGFVVPNELRRDRGTLSLVQQLLGGAVEGVRSPPDPRGRPTEAGRPQRRPRGWDRGESRGDDQQQRWLAPRRGHPLGQAGGIGAARRGSLGAGGTGGLAGAGVSLGASGDEVYAGGVTWDAHA